MFCKNCDREVPPTTNFSPDPPQGLLGLVCPDCGENFLAGASSVTCRVCGFVGDEVRDRVTKFAKWDHAQPEQIEDLRLCDLCACIGSLCAGADGYASVAQLTQCELISLLRTVIWKIRGEPEE